MLTLQQMTAANPRAPIADWYSPLIEAMAKYEINTTKRAAFFLANVFEETGDLRHLEENLRYDAPRLMAVFPSLFRGSLAKAQEIAAKGPEGIANFIYDDANRPAHYGMGNTYPGAGWRNRGRGPMMTTGEDNYRDFFSSIGMDPNSDRDLLLKPIYGALSAARIWQRGGCNELADSGAFLATVQKMNGGYTNLADRKRYLAQIEEALGLGDDWQEAA